MKKKIMLILSDGFEDIEAIAVIDILNRAGVEVTIVSLKEGPVKAAYGTIIVPHTTIDKISGEFDGIVFPGGKVNAENLASHTKVIELVKKYNASHKLVAAICAAPSHVLAEAAGILKGRRASGDPVFNDKFVSAGVIITDELVTIDDNIITGMGPGAALPFALKLAEYLVGSEIRQSLAAKWRLEL